jgi:hypothetical protein
VFSFLTSAIIIITIQETYKHLNGFISTLLGNSYRGKATYGP